MNTATLTAAVRSHFPLPAGVLAALQRAGAARSVPAAPAARQREKSATTWISNRLDRTIACANGMLWLTFDNGPQDVFWKLASRIAVPRPRSWPSTRWSPPA